MFNKTLTSKKYFSNGGPLPLAGDIDFDTAMSREVERKIVEIVREQGWSLSGKSLVRATLDEGVLENLRKDPALRHFPNTKFDICLLQVRERGYWLQTTENNSKWASEDLRVKALAGVFGLVLLCAVGFYYFGWMLFEPSATAPIAQTTGMCDGSGACPEGQVESLSEAEIQALAAATIEARAKDKGAQTAPEKLPDGYLLHGSKDSAKRVDIFSRFTCPNCPRAHEVLEALSEDPEMADVAIYHHNLPGDTEISQMLSLYYTILKQIAPDTAKKYVSWAFENQDEFRGGIKNNALAWFKDEQGLDLQTFSQLAHDPAVYALVQTDQIEANRMNIRYSPTLIVNGKKLIGSNITVTNIKQALGG